MAGEGRPIALNHDQTHFFSFNGPVLKNRRHYATLLRTRVIFLAPRCLSKDARNICNSCLISCFHTLYLLVVKYSSSQNIKDDIGT